MHTYPNVLDAREFAEVKTQDTPLYVVQPKYDGSNVLKFGDALYTRNLHPLDRASPKFAEIIRNKFKEILQCKYDFYFEFGGKKYAQAGYRDSWNFDEDYRVFDAYDLTYEGFRRIVSECGLRAVETLYVGPDLKEAIRVAVEFVKSNPNFEGAVIKAYAPKLIAVGKVKRANLDDWVSLMQGRLKEKVSREAPTDEIRAWVHKAFLELSASKDPKTITANDVWQYVQKEIRQHGYDMSPTAERRYRAIVKQTLEEVKRKMR